MVGVSSRAIQFSQKFVVVVGGFPSHLARLRHYGKILRQLQWISLYWIRPKSQPDKPNRLSLRLLRQSGKAFSLTRRSWTAGLRTTWVSIELELIFTSLLSLYVSLVAVLVWHNPLARCLDEGIYAEVCTLFCFVYGKAFRLVNSECSDWLYFRACLLVTVRSAGCKNPLTTLSWSHPLSYWTLPLMFHVPLLEFLA